MAEEDRFFIRVRGRVSGPFDVATLQRQVKRGTLSRIHEVSADRVAWNPAGDFEDLFPLTPTVTAVAEPPAPSPPIQTPGPTDMNVDVPPVSHTAHVGRTTALYFYTQRGSTVGPVGLAVLRSLAENGTLRPTDLVWREDAETGAPAAQFPALAPLFARSSNGGWPHTVSLHHNEDAERAARALASASHWSQRVGVRAGVTLLILLNLPWLTVDKKPIWWWDLFNAPGAHAGALFLTLLNLTAVALCFVGPLTRGMARGITYLSLMFALWAFLVIAGLNNSRDLLNLTAPLIVPVSLALLSGVCLFRHFLPDAISGRVLLGICSGVATLGMFVGVVSVVQDPTDFSQIPGGVTAGIVLVFLGLLCGLTAGILGFVGLKKDFSPGLNLSTAITATVSLALPGLGILIALSAASTFFIDRFGDNGTLPISQMNEWKWIVIEIVTRVLIITYGCLTVAAVGLRELLTAAQFGSTVSTLDS